MCSTKNMWNIVFLFLTLGCVSCKAVSEQRPPITVDNTAQLEPFATLPGENNSQVNALAFNPEGTLLAVGKGGYDDSHTTNNIIELWDVENLELKTTLPGHILPVTDVEFSPDGTLLASGAGHPDGGADDDAVRLWDVDTTEELMILPGITSSAKSLAFSPDGTFLAYNQGGVNLWDVQAGAIDRTLEVEGWFPKDVIFSPDGSLIAASIYDRPGLVNPQIWDAKTYQSIAILDTWGICNLTFSPDSGLLITAAIERYADGTRRILIQYWSTDTFAELGSFEIEGEHVPDIVFGPDGTILAIVTSDEGYYTLGSLHLWNTETWEELTILGLQETTAVAFNPDGTILASGNIDGSVYLWGVTP